MTPQEVAATMMFMASEDKAAAVLTMSPTEQTHSPHNADAYSTIMANMTSDALDLDAQASYLASLTPEECATMLVNMQPAQMNAMLGRLPQQVSENALEAAKAIQRKMREQEARAARDKHHGLLRIREARTL